MKKKYLILQDGTVFEGRSAGYDGETTGELVFTTGMCGYIETLTDASYCGQIVMQTFPLIGNYGWISEDEEGACLVKGYAAREICSYPSNYRCEETLDAYLKSHKITAIEGIDTRQVTRIIRNHGVMNAMIADEIPSDLSKIADYRVAAVVEAASAKKSYVVEAENTQRFHVALIDYGMKKNISRQLAERGCRVSVYPCSTTAEEILSSNPDGIMLSNGPGDPQDNIFMIAQIRELLGKKPLFGVCLGHQMTALAAGGSTFKLKYGHRGINQPVRDLKTGRTMITTQNHGYAVNSDSLKGIGIVRYVNANDGTCEGVDYPDLNAFTVQFHPEACPGPEDTSFLFDRFLSMMEGQ